MDISPEQIGIESVYVDCRHLDILGGKTVSLVVGGEFEFAIVLPGAAKAMVMIPMTVEEITAIKDIIDKAAVRAYQAIKFGEGPSRLGPITEMMPR